MREKLFIGKKCRGKLLNPPKNTLGNREVRLDGGDLKKLLYFTVNELMQSMRKHYGNFVNISNELGVSSSYLRRLVNGCKEFRDFRKNCVKDLGSKSESNVISAINLGDIETAKWYLTKRNKKYKNQVKIEHEVSSLSDLISSIEE